MCYIQSDNSQIPTDLFEQKIAKRFFCVRLFNIPYQVCLTGTCGSGKFCRIHTFGKKCIEFGKICRTNSADFACSFYVFCRFAYAINFIYAISSTGSKDLYKVHFNLYVFYINFIFIIVELHTTKIKRNNMEQIKKKKSKAVTFTLNDETLSMLAELAEKNSNSQSYEVRRLIKDEYTRKFKQRETIK